MNVYKYCRLKKICCRAAHLAEGFKPLISLEACNKLKWDFVAIAMAQEQAGVLKYCTSVPI